MAVYLDGTIVRQEKLSEDIRLMEIRCPEVAAAAQPGQFVTVRVNQLHEPLAPAARSGWPGRTGRRGLFP